MLYRQIKWWKDAFHVYYGDLEAENRIGIVNRHTVRINGRFIRTTWEAHNTNFLPVGGEYPNRSAAAAALSEDRFINLLKRS